MYLIWDCIRIYVQILTHFDIQCMLGYEVQIYAVHVVTFRGMWLPCWLIQLLAF